MIDLFLAALAAALPLPVTGLVPWWAAGLYAVPLIWQAWRSRRGNAPSEIDGRMMNALSLACLGLFVLDMTLLSRRLIQVAVHLSLSLIALKAFHMRTGRDRAQFALLAFFLAVAGAANSTHPLLAVHLLVLLALFAAWLLQAAGLPAGAARRTAAGLTLACTLIAAPLFFMLPRLRGPYVPGGQQRANEAASFTLDTLGLEGVASAKNDQRVALRVRFQGVSVGEESLRLRARTFDVFRKGSWTNTEVRYRLRRFRSDGLLWLGRREGRPQQSMEAFPKELSAQYLPLPYGTAGLEARLNYAHAGDDGTVRLSAWIAQRQFHYRAFIDPGAEPEPAAWSSAHLALPDGLERDLRDLAGRVMPDGVDPQAQTDALVRFFASGYRYSLEDYSAAADPLREFLFTRKRGHCELYATAGALLLRARGIPARVAVGFLGGERNPLQDYYVVRFRNAHAWIEAWLNGGWRVVDPTPAEFRPSLERGTLAGQAQLWWETLSFFWDRHVLGFAFADQADLAGTLLGGAGAAGRLAAWAVGALTLAALAVWAARAMRPEPLLLRRYRRLRRTAAARLGEQEASLAPETVERAFLELEPTLAAEAAAFFGAYRRFSFGQDDRGGMPRSAGAAYRRLIRVARRRASKGQRPR